MLTSLSFEIRPVYTKDPLAILSLTIDSIPEEDLKKVDEAVNQLKQFIEGKKEKKTLTEEGFSELNESVVHSGAKKYHANAKTLGTLYNNLFEQKAIEEKTLKSEKARLPKVEEVGTAPLPPTP